MDPRELNLFTSAVANGLYERLSPAQVTVLAAVFTQLGAALETLAAQAEFLEDRRSRERGA